MKIFKGAQYLFRPFHYNLFRHSSIIRSHYCFEIFTFYYDSIKNSQIDTDKHINLYSFEVKRNRSKRS